MTLHDPVIAALSEANPIDPTAQPGPRERAEADAIRHHVVSSPARSRPRAATLVPVLGTVVVLAITAVFLGAGARHRRAPAAHSTARTLILQALPTGQTPMITPTVMAHELQIVRERLSSVPGSAHATLAGTNRIRVVVGRGVSPAERGRIIALLARSAQLYFYDWEANALTPNGRTVASQLLTQNVSALQISQGAGAAPGYPGSGSMSLYDAVKLASKQPTTPFSPSLSRPGLQYYLFGKPGSAACATAAVDSQTRLTKGRYCLLSGPTEETSRTARDQALTDLDTGLPAGVTPAQLAGQSQVLVVPQGTVVIQAANPSSSHQTTSSSAGAQFYVLKDNVALTGKDITDPTQGTDQSGAPDVRFGFTPKGAARFRKMTAQVARRGANVSLAGQTENQHFAVILSGVEDQLTTVVSIDFKQYPDGINPSGVNNGADISGEMTATSAKDLATQLRYGALPLNLRALVR